jgi:TatA/E family protein of Tat protein translocase
MSVGPMEIIIVLALALLIFGPKRLPEMGRTLGRAAREFRKASDEVKGVLNLDLDEDEDDQKAAGGAAAVVTAVAPAYTPGDGPWSPEDTGVRNDYPPAADRPGAEAPPGLAGFLGVAQAEPEAAAAADVSAAPAFASFLGASAADADAEAEAPAPAGTDDPALTAAGAVAEADTVPAPESPAAEAVAEAGTVPEP